MTQELSTALLLLAVGMITVFIILSLVVASGHLIIRLVNRFSNYVPSRSTLARKAIPTNTSTLSPKKVAAMVAAVQILTAGNGKIVKIERVLEE